jgi:hypothetical protein
VKFKLKHRDKIIDNLSLAGGDTKNFWQLIDKLQQSSNGKKVEPNDIPASGWYHHFKSLFCKTINNKTKEQNDIENYLNDDKNWKVFNELSFAINGQRY